MHWRARHCFPIGSCELRARRRGAVRPARPRARRTARRPGSGERSKEFGWALEGDNVLFPELEREQAKMAAQVAADPKAFLGDFALSDADARRARASGTDAGDQGVGVDPETEVAESFRWLRDGIPAAGSS